MVVVQVDGPDLQVARVNVIGASYPGQPKPADTDNAKAATGRIKERVQAGLDADVGAGARVSDAFEKQAIMQPG